MAQSRRQNIISISNLDFEKPYFHFCLLAYSIALLTAILAMLTFDVAQPALLYLSPACSLTPIGVGYFRGELKELFGYTTERNQKMVNNIKKKN